MMAGVDSRCNPETCNNLVRGRAPDLVRGRRGAAQLRHEVRGELGYKAET